MKSICTSYVYVVSTLAGTGAIAPVKIGITDNPRSRFATLKNACPNPVLLSMFFGPMTRVEASRVEKECHRAAVRFRRNGEWFDISPAAAIEIVSAATSLICIGGLEDEVRYAKLSSALGVACANMYREPS